MLFTTLCTGWILKKRTRKYSFAQKHKNPNIGETKTINPPSLPLEGPYLPPRGRSMGRQWRQWDVNGTPMGRQRGKIDVRCSLFPHIAIIFRNAPNIKYPQTTH